ncbi:RecE family exodeoxyribonuclease [Enterobacter hormaechei]|uniref:RecE family exodeoxyribonuclease n=1 Tax=Enterobacter hormaechei TaxID=158836 RepID=UPI002738A50F|nr:RecE family exodeoxyribonuclease [Enterobacter hormaechei]MDZ5681158.1 RecE family exodeoxyribonuclease [Enterobacter hormaechei]WLP09779.1 RecE family exodeoxyribonuclease [Enterobacter hormaechei]HCD9773805.1 PD-(D/E)XK nuclease-like domain-containing protein [Enterobacter hormaechei]HCE3973270.1 PD-(D/E)XK nuclease-like domain-containing protein [Enterobacter hormaechei]
MEFFYVVKATQKSGKEDAVIWFTAKSEARANLQLDVELEDAGIETGRGKDYAKPVRTDFPVYNDLPEESAVDYTWCKRYALQDDGRTWLPKAGAESPEVVGNTAAPETTVNVETTDESVTLENRTPAVRFAFHLTSDKYHTHISKEQQLAASEMSLDEGNTYLQNLLLAKNDIPEVAELSLNAEWKLVQAIKQVFAPDETHESEVIAAFMADWARADASYRNQLIEEWRNGKLNLLKSESASETGVTTGQVPEPETGIQIDENDDETTRYPVIRMPFRKQLLAQFTADELRHHLTREEYEGISALEMDTDNSYVQNLLLAAENCEEVKGYDTKDLWRYTDAIRKLFSQEKRHELALVLRFTRIWAATDYIDRGTLVREWVEGNRISEVGSPAPLEPEKPETTESYKRAVAQNMANLSIEIAIAQLYPDAVPGQINRTQLLAAKELADKKDESHAKALKVLGKTTDILDYDANSIFGVTRAISWSGEESTTELRSQVREWFTANGIYESGERSKGYPEWNEDSREVRHSTVEEPSTPSQTKVASLGSGVFSIDGLMGGNTDPVINTSSNEIEKTENTAETTSDVQMETAKPEKDEDVGSVPPSESTDAANSQTDSVEADQLHETTIDVQESNPEVEFPAYFEPGRYEGMPNDVYHAANGISSTQVKDARVSLMYFNARHVEKTIVKERSAVLDMGNLVHALALQPEQLDAEFSVEPVIPEGAFTTAATLRAFIDEHNASLPALLSADDIKVLLEEYNATLPPQVPLGANLEETAQNYMALPADFQRIDGDQKQTATAMKACIKEYNATLPTPVKTSGSRDALLEQLAIINPDLVAQEAQKPAPLKVSGTKADMIQAVKAAKPDAVFADELLDAWRDNPEGKVLVTRQQLSTALDIQKALLAHPTAGMLLTHPSRAVEVSYFGFDEETGLEVRVRPDLEIDLDGVRIGADLKTISMWNVKQESLRARLHREIIERDYHLSAAMYCETAALDQFFWIFVNKDENYHWIAIIEASADLLELGMLEYRKAMRAIATGFDTGEWPAPIIDDYTDELNDFDLRRLEALRAQA